MSDQPNPTIKFISSAEVMGRIGLSPSSIKYYRKRFEQINIKPVKCGTKWLWDENEINIFLVAVKSIGSVELAFKLRLEEGEKCEK